MELIQAQFFPTGGWLRGFVAKVLGVALGLHWQSQDRARVAVPKL